MIDKDLEKYYDGYREMFITSGWKQLQEDLTQNASIIDSVQACKDNEDLYFRKGQLAIISNLVNLEDQIKAAEEQANEAEEPE
jgi:hypothetical protein|tara:strand:- start:576 stop:824 length:249 start_codon:yes stop_codon:yes gene_type:complete